MTTVSILMTTVFPLEKRGKTHVQVRRYREHVAELLAKKVEVLILQSKELGRFYAAK